MINHSRKSLKEKMIKTGICYLRAGDSNGSLCKLLALNDYHTCSYTRIEKIANFSN